MTKDTEDKIVALVGSMKAACIIAACDDVMCAALIRNGEKLANDVLLAIELETQTQMQEEARQRVEDLRSQMREEARAARVQRDDQDGDDDYDVDVEYVP